jgi:hypothetical protein
VVNVEFGLLWLLLFLITGAAIVGFGFLLFRLTRYYNRKPNLPAEITVREIAAAEFNWREGQSMPVRRRYNYPAAHEVPSPPVIDEQIAYSLSVRVQELERQIIDHEKRLHQVDGRDPVIER